jgi:hypothetical protein
MATDPIAILERLLRERPAEKNVHYLKASRDFSDTGWTYEEMGAIEDEFAHDLRTVAERISADWGPPEFLGHRCESAFPEFYVVEEFCYWQRDGLLAMVWWEHQDKEVPVLLAVAVVAPDDPILG